MNRKLFLTILLFIGTTVLVRTVTAQDTTNNARIQEQTGSVSGKIVIQAMIMSETSERGTRYHSSGMAPMTHPTATTMNKYSNMVVYLEGEDLGQEKAKDIPKTLMDQRNAEFIPHILPIQQGTVVDFVNQDNMYHNIFSLSSTKKFNIGRRPTGEAVPIQFDKAGIVQIFCDIHSQMTAYIVVLKNPYFIQPDEHGNYTLENVPVGTYTLKVWHERLSSKERTITISPNRTTTINFVME